MLCALFLDMPCKLRLFILIEMYKSLNGKHHSPLEHKPIVVFFKSHKNTLQVTASYIFVDKRGLPRHFL